MNQRVGIGWRMQADGLQAGLGKWLQFSVAAAVIGVWVSELCAIPPIEAPPYFSDETEAAVCGQWVRDALQIVSDDATCPCRRFTPEAGGCDMIPMQVTGHPSPSANGWYWALRLQRCEESFVTLSDDFSPDASNMGAFKLITTSGVYQNGVPQWTFIAVPSGDGMASLKLPLDPMGCCPTCVGDSESAGGVCHQTGKLIRKITYLAPASGMPDTMQRWMRIRASATIKLDARLHRLGCLGTGSATVSGRSEVMLMQNLTLADIGVNQKVPGSIAGERTFDFSGATATGSSGFKLKLGATPEVEIGFTGSSTVPADGNLRILAKSEKIDWESRNFCKAPPALPTGVSHADFLVELSGEVISRALLAMGREAECKTQVHLHDVDVSFGECVQCFENETPSGPNPHNP